MNDQQVRLEIIRVILNSGPSPLVKTMDDIFKLADRMAAWVIADQERFTMPPTLKYHTDTGIPVEFE